MENKAPKLIENPKSAIFIKGKKSSNVVNQILKELHVLRGGEYNKLFMRKSHDMHPFEDHAPLESFSKKQDCSLFCFGNDQKKRPDNIVMGRTYDGRVLDMFEFGVLDFQSVEQFKAAEVPRELKPVLVF